MRSNNKTLWDLKNTDCDWILSGWLLVPYWILTDSLLACYWSNRDSNLWNYAWSCDPWLFSLSFQGRDPYRPETADGGCTPVWENKPTCKQIYGSDIITTMLRGQGHRCVSPICSQQHTYLSPKTTVALVYLRCTFNIKSFLPDEPN